MNGHHLLVGKWRIAYGLSLIAIGDTLLAMRDMRITFHASRFTFDDTPYAICYMLYAIRYFAQRNPRSSFAAVGSALLRFVARTCFCSSNQPPPRVTRNFSPKNGDDAPPGYA